MSTPMQCHGQSGSAVIMYNNNDGNDGQIRKGKRTVSENKLHDHDLPQ